MMKSTVLVCGALSLAACGGSTTTGGGGGDGGGSTVSFANMVSASEALAMPYDEMVRTQQYVQHNDLATTGSATYNGYLGGEIATATCTTDRCRAGFVPPAFDGAGTEFVGDLQITADFGTRMLEGSAENFVTSDNEALVGTLTIAPDSFPDNGPADPAINAELTGTLTGQGITNTVAATLVGQFYDQPTGQTPVAILGTLEGGFSVGSGDVELGELAEIVDGGFVATQ